MKVEKSISVLGILSKVFKYLSHDHTTTVHRKEELEEVNYFKIEELQDLDNEGFEWLDNLKKVIGKV